MGIQIGSLSLDSPVLLAPMSGVTDLPFRRLVRSFGAGLVFSEMIASQSMVQETRESCLKSDMRLDDFPAAVQLAGSDSGIMAEAARLNRDRGAALIDINFGCPVKKVVNKACGSALMREPALAASIVDAVVRAVAPLPVTVKMRLGWDDRSRNAALLARLCVDAGAQMITVHGRTREQMYGGVADWAAVRDVIDAVTVPVIVNGDIGSPDEARRAMAQSGADGVMIGRGACGRPWVLRDVMHAMKGSPVRQAPEGDPLKAVVIKHYEALLQHYGDVPGVRIARKHLAWYADAAGLEPSFKIAVNRSADPKAVVALINHYFGVEGQTPNARAA